MAHIHPPVTGVNASCVNHSHTLPTSSDACGFAGAPAHYHFIATTVADAHNHTVDLAFGPATPPDGGGWVVHTHAVTVSNCTGGGADHDHDPTTSPTGGSGCSKCIKTGTHAHVHSVATDNYDYSAHTHTWTGQVTGNAAGGSPHNHTHLVAITSDAGGSHSHTTTGTITANVCTQGSNHGHSRQDTNAYAHTASVSSATPAYGEKKRPLVGVGN